MEAWIRVMGGDLTIGLGTITPHPAVGSTT